MTDKNSIQDEPQRQRALAPEQSFIVQAPAGSGKTELLAQRVLVLLSHVNAPEEILAITFTKKAASEMRARIISALHKAQTEPEPTAEHAKKTWHLAKLALQRDQTLGWHLLANPNRLRIQTIDSFNASLTKYLPILSHFGAPPEICDKPDSLYREAVQEFLSHLEEEVAWSDAIAQLLIHCDNDLEKVQDLLVNMLAKRDQWLPYIMVDSDQTALRQALEGHLAAVVSDTLATLCDSFPIEHTEELISLAYFAAQNLQASGNTSALLNISALPGKHQQDKTLWLSISELLLTKDHSWRKSIDKKIGFPAPSNATNPEEKVLLKTAKERMEALITKLSGHEKLHAALISLQHAPASDYQDNQWQTLHALYTILRIVVAQLNVTFRQHGKIDYIENAQAALYALGTDEAPTDLALALDYQIRHILIDEFQDTSSSQYRLIQKLITGWETGDGRTLFVVGDPMQSIYRFREAEVGLFIRSRKQGIGNIKLEPLTLSVNFRSTAVIVDWVNHHFQRILPSFDDLATGAVSYSQSIANQANSADVSLVKIHPNVEKDDHAQAETIVQLIRNLRQNNPKDKIAILVRARTHLTQIIPALKKANLAYRAIDIDKLDSRPVIQDLMALTRALLHLGDRVAWLAILRAPWCGMQLSDLLLLVGNHPSKTVFELLQKPDLVEQLSADGQQRLKKITPILRAKLAERRRYSLRLWLESTWLLLGGPACLDFSADIEDANAFFQLLENVDQGGEITDLDNLAHEVSRLFAAPNNQADDSLQIMTIFNAKGLEFDTVILPHLEKQLPNEKKQLMLWMEKPREKAENALVLAPIHATGAESDAIYDHIKKQHAIKSDHEIGRLLYVAATRAKKQLHLFMTPKLKDIENNDDLFKAKSKSLLDKLWPAIKSNTDFQSLSTAETSIDTTEQPQRSIKRLTLNWSNPIQEGALTAAPSYHQSAPGFHVSQNNAKHMGTLAHQILQQMSQQGVSWWKNQQLDQQKSYIKKHLCQLGVLPKDIDDLAQIILQALTKTLQDPRALWILQPHQEAKSEFAVTAQIDNEIKVLVIDRTFIDENGTRWIIDYKTSHFAEEGLEQFLQAEKNKYAEQMRFYQQALQKLDNRPVRLGLYFPMVSGWLEWS